MDIDFGVLEEFENHLNSEGSGEHDTETLPDFQEDGIDYFCENEITVPRSKIPDFIYEIIPHIDYISHAEITLKKDSEQLWVHEWDDGEVVISLFISRSLKDGDNRYSSGLRYNQNKLEQMAKKIAPITQKKSDRPIVSTDKNNPRNLNYLINKIN